MVPLLLLVGCSLPTSPADPEIEVWFEGVPLEQYSSDPIEWYAFQAHALQTPADTTFWRLDYYGLFGWVQIEEGQTDPGLRAGHRWYTLRDVPILLKFTAWSRSAMSASVTLDYPR